MENISDLIVELNSRRLKFTKKHDPKRYVSAWIEEDLHLNNSDRVNALVVILRTNGCNWSRFAGTDGSTSMAITGGCLMCGYRNDCMPPSQPVSADAIIYQFNSALAKYSDKQFGLVKIFTSGSFLDCDEVPRKAQETILKTLKRLGIDHVIFETRPHFVNADDLDSLSSMFGGQIQIALGLESANDNVRKFAINKGFTFEEYCSAVQIAQELNVMIKTYLLLKPPFMSERDAINDVIQSILKLHTRAQPDCISINPVNVQKFTIVEYLFDRNDYRPPWLWSVVDVLERGHALLAGSGRNIRLLSHPTAGGMRKGAHNCYNCDQQLLEAINKFSLNNDPKFFEHLDCSCRNQWKDILSLEDLNMSTLNTVRKLR